MPLRSLHIAIGLLVASLFSPVSLSADGIDDDLAAIGRAGPNAEGSAEARAACDLLAARGVDILPRLLDSLDTPNVVAANWYRTVYETIVARELGSPAPQFPVELLKKSVRDADRQPRARRLVLALVERLEPGFTQKMLPDLLDDPEFRGEAVELALTEADRALAAGETDRAKEHFRSAFDHAREASQVTRAAERLVALGEVSDPIAHLGFVIHWRIRGPFEAAGYSGFNTAFPPEEALDSGLSIGGEGAAVREHETADPLGLVDLNLAIGSSEEAVAYASSTIESPREQAGQLRASADDNLTVWLNGDKLLAREQWLNGSRLDRFAVPATLRAGKNEILVKVCQGPRHKDPAVPNNWTFQVRFCDESGRGLEFGRVEVGAEKSGAEPCEPD